MEFALSRHLIGAQSDFRRCFSAQQPFQNPSSELEFENLGEKSRKVSGNGDGAEFKSFAHFLKQNSVHSLFSMLRSANRGRSNQNLRKFDEEFFFIKRTNKLPFFFKQRVNYL